MAAKLLILLAILVLLCCLTAFHTPGHGVRRRVALMVAPKPPGISRTKEGKAIILARTKKMVEACSMIMVAPIKGVSGENVQLLRSYLPEGTKASVVKNTLLRIAVNHTQFQPIGDDMKQSNMYLFIPQGKAKAALDAFRKWQKEVKRTDPQHCIKAGAVEGAGYPLSMLDEVVSLPSREVLATQVIQVLKSVPQKLVGSLKFVPNRLAMAFAMLEKKRTEDEKAAAGAADGAAPTPAPPPAAAPA